MITLYQFSPVWGIPNLSHFCVKVETYLRMTGVPYQVVATLPLKAPRGKLPYIEDKGNKIADSRFIIRYLQSQYGNTMDDHLTDLERATAKAWQRLIEEHLYWLSMYTRWNYSDTNWLQNKCAIFSGLPIFVRDCVALAYRRLIKKQIYGQGTGRLSEENIDDLAAEDVSALAVFLANNDYFMGDIPSTVDATVYGFLINIIACPIESPLKNKVLEEKLLVAYCQRMQSRYFPECGDISL
ncbi:MAG: glutathione S-transferase family protein [Methylococcaceae bacterium]